MFHLGIEGQNDHQSKNNHFSLFVMLKLVEKDPSFVLIPHQAPEILHFMILLMVWAAVLENTL